MCALWHGHVHMHTHTTHKIVSVIKTSQRGRHVVRVCSPRAQETEVGG